MPKISPQLAMFVTIAPPGDVLALQVGAQVHARQALKVRFVNRRRAVEKLDALVRRSFLLQFPSPMLH
jgi:hypothetical protein